MKKNIVQRTTISNKSDDAPSRGYTSVIGRVSLFGKKNPDDVTDADSEEALAKPESITSALRGTPLQQRGMCHFQQQVHRQKTSPLDGTLNSVPNPEDEPARLAFSSTKSHNIQREISSGGHKDTAQSAPAALKKGKSFADPGNLRGGGTGSVGGDHQKPHLSKGKSVVFNQALSDGQVHAAAASLGGSVDSSGHPVPTNRLSLGQLLELFHRLLESHETKLCVQLLDFLAESKHSQAMLTVTNQDIMLYFRNLPNYLNTGQLIIGQAAKSPESLQHRKRHKHFESHHNAYHKVDTCTSSWNLRGIAGCRPPSPKDDARKQIQKKKTTQFSEPDDNKKSTLKKRTNTQNFEAAPATCGDGAVETRIKRATTAHHFSSEAAPVEKKTSSLAPVEKKTSSLPEKLAAQIKSATASSSLQMQISAKRVKSNGVNQSESPAAHTTISSSAPTVENPTSSLVLSEEPALASSSLLESPKSGVASVPTARLTQSFTKDQSGSPEQETNNNDKDSMTQYSLQLETLVDDDAKVVEFSTKAVAPSPKPTAVTSPVSAFRKEESEKLQSATFNKKGNLPVLNVSQEMDGEASEEEDGNGESTGGDKHRQWKGPPSATMLFDDEGYDDFDDFSPDYVTFMHSGTADAEDDEFDVDSEVLDEIEVWNDGENPREQRWRFLVLYPHSDALNFWCLCSLFAIILEAALVPFHVSFDVEYPIPWYWITTVWFSIDMILRCMTGFYLDGNTIMDTHRILTRYASSFLIIDVVSTIPWHYILFSNPHDHLASINKERLPFLICLRLLRLSRLGEMLANLDEILPGTVLIVSSFLKMLLSFVFLCHWGACLWAFLGNPEKTGHPSMNAPYYDLDGCEPNGPCEGSVMGSPWTHRYGLDRPEFSSLGHRYLISISFIVALVTGGDLGIHPGWWGERVFFVFMMTLSFMFCSTILSQIVVFVEKFTKEKAEFREQMGSVKEYLNRRKVPRVLRAKVKRYLEFQFRSRSRADHNLEFIHQLSPWLRLEVKEHLNREVIIRHPFFQNMPTMAFKRVCAIASTVLYAGGDIVAQRGHTASCMFFLVVGRLKIITPKSERKRNALTQPEYGLSASLGVEQQGSEHECDSNDSHNHNNDNIEAVPSRPKPKRTTMFTALQRAPPKVEKPSDVLEPPSWIGDQCLFRDMTRRRTVVCLKDSELLTLPKDLFQTILLEFPKVQPWFEEWTAKVNKGDLVSAGMQCEFCSGFGHNSQDCPQMKQAEKEEMASEGLCGKGKWNLVRQGVNAAHDAAAGVKESNSFSIAKVVLSAAKQMCTEDAEKKDAKPLSCSQESTASYSAVVVTPSDAWPDQRQDGLAASEKKRETTQSSEKKYSDDRSNKGSNEIPKKESSSAFNMDETILSHPNEVQDNELEAHESCLV